MSCKFKRMHDGCTKPYCYVTDGECLFLISPYDDNCAILKAYKDLIPIDDKNREDASND